MKKIFITGSTGCIGSYVTERFLSNDNYELHLLVRNPSRLKFNYEKYPGVVVHTGDIAKIEEHRETISQANYIIHIATAWGKDNGELINVEKTCELFLYADPKICERIIYFSTASILGRGNRPVKEALTEGTPYIRTKYMAHEKLQKSPIYEKIITLFPTLVFGGDESHPFSHISKGLIKNNLWYLRLLSFFYANCTFHFLHGKDIAKVTEYILIHNEIKEKEYVLGNTVITAKEAIKTICKVFNIPIYFRFKITPAIVFFTTWLFRIKINPWDRFCIKNPFFEYNTVNPSSFGLKGSFPTLESIMEDIKLLRCIL